MCIPLSSSTYAGDRAKCSCNGTTDKYITCQNNGQWSPLTCSNDCPNPGVPRNGQRIGDDFAPRSIVHYYCNNGYELLGSSVSFCGANGQWNTSVPVCLISCGSPSQLINGLAVGNEYSYGSNVSFVCYNGFKLNGQSSIFCEKNGEWSDDTPNCRVIYCSPPVVPIHGIANYTSLTANSTVNYTCQAGYTLHGVANITCLANGNWSDVNTPTCHNYSCSTPCNKSSCPLLPSPSHGSLYPIATYYSIGSNVSLNCNTDYTLSDNSNTIMCTSGGSWNATLPSCTITSKISIVYLLCIYLPFLSLFSI